MDDCLAKRLRTNIYIAGIVDARGLDFPFQKMVRQWWTRTIRSDPTLDSVLSVPRSNHPHETANRRPPWLIFQGGRPRRRSSSPALTQSGPRHSPEYLVMQAALPPPPAAPAAHRTDPRQKVSRSSTSQSGSQQPAPGRPRRSQSEDSSSQDIRAARAANARTKSHGAVPRTTDRDKDKDKPSQHADIIDQMDPSGLGGKFHHDGPFDAVAPSRNRQGKPHRAPVYAFEPGTSGPHNVPVVDKRLSPLAQATIAAMASSDGPYA
ncbi:hypothetical protein M407DRAFT_165294, partial [Tulasnella calospora MUT 4182]